MRRAGFAMHAAARRSRRPPPSSPLKQSGGTAAPDRHRSRTGSRRVRRRPFAFRPCGPEHTPRSLGTTARRSVCRHPTRQRIAHSTVLRMVRLTSAVQGAHRPEACVGEYRHGLPWEPDLDGACATSALTAPHLSEEQCAAVEQRPPPRSLLPGLPQMRSPHTRYSHPTRVQQGTLPSPACGSKQVLVARDRPAVSPTAESRGLCFCLPRCFTAASTCSHCSTPIGTRSVLAFHPRSNAHAPQV